MVSRSFGSASPAVFSYRRAPNSLDDIFIVRQTPPFMQIHVRSKASARAAEDCIQRSSEIAKRKRNEAKSDVVRSGRDL
jgi:hypothetical protein